MAGLRSHRECFEMVVKPSDFAKLWESDTLVQA